jgi:AGCS family alanine or glycine:cation symporter
MVQANATSNIFISSFSIPKEITGIALAFLTGIVLIGGIKSIGRFASFCVPFMIVIYLATMFVVLGINFDKIPDALGLIFSSAFSGTAAAGGFVGATLAAAIRFGVSRGLFSNESGLGSAAIAAASAKTNDPVKQALVSMTGTFIDTLVVCTMTALVILTSDVWLMMGINEAAEITSKSVEASLGQAGAIIIAFATGLFAFSTLIGWGFYGEKALEFLFGTKAITLYRIIYTFLVFIGATIPLVLVWDFSDVMFGMMAIPNLIGLIFLIKIIKSETNRFFKKTS